MKMINKMQPGGQHSCLTSKGFAISGIMYAILIISLLLVLGTLKTIQNRKTIIDKLKSETVNAVDSNNYQNLLNEVNNLKSRLTTLENNITSLESITSDTGWIDLSSYLCSNVSLYSTNSKIQYRKIGKIVEIRGELRPISLVSSYNEVPILSGIPASIRPSYNIHAIQQGSGINRWFLLVKTDGSIYFARYGTNSYTNPDSGDWLPINIVYFID